jgi:hypothetical protein
MMRCNKMPATNPQIIGSIMFDASKQFQEYTKQFQSLFSANSAPAAASLEKVRELNQELAQSIANASKLAFENAQKFFAGQASFFQEQAQKAANAATKAVSAKTPEESIEGQTKYAQEAIDASIQNAQSAAKTASEAAVKTFDIINKQTVEYISEVSKIAANGN